MTSTAAHRRFLRRDTAVVLLMLAAGSLLSSCAASADQARPAGSSSTQASAPVWTTLTASEAFKALTTAQQAKVRSLEAMDMATFEQQSHDNQLAFGAFVREVYQSYGIAATEKNAPGLKLPPARDMTAASTGQEILDDEGLKLVTALWSARPNAETADPVAESNSVKLAPSRVVKRFPTAYATASKSMINPDGRPVSTRTEVIDMARSWFSEKKPTAETPAWLPSGEKYGGRTYKIVQTVSEFGTIGKQSYFSYFPFTDIRGEKVGTWVLTADVLDTYREWNPNVPAVR